MGVHQVMQPKPWKYTCDDITLVALLQADDHIRFDECVASDETEKRAKNTHCVWHLLVTGYTEDELQELVDYFYAFGGKCRPDDRRFSFRCRDCGMAWITDGPCGDECGRVFLGRFPDFHYFDAVKRDVIYQKRRAQEELADERGEGQIYAQR